MGLPVFERAKSHDFVLRDDADPLLEIRRQIEIQILSPKYDADFLEHLFGVGRVPEQGHQVGIQPVVVLSENAREILAVILFDHGRWRGS